MGLVARGTELIAESVQAPGDVMLTKIVYGKECSMMLATRAGGYHSRPHIHDCEQMNYVIDGEIWLFVEDECFLVRKGDFYRIPPMAVHWGWNRSEKPCTILEIHVPPLDLCKFKHAVGLLADDEEFETRKGKRSYVVSDEYTRIEEKLGETSSR